MNAVQTITFTNLFYGFKKMIIDRDNSVNNKNQKWWCKYMKHILHYCNIFSIVANHLHLQLDLQRERFCC